MFPTLEGATIRVGGGKVANSGDSDGVYLVPVVGGYVGQVRRVAEATKSGTTARAAPLLVVIILLYFTILEKLMLADSLSRLSSTRAKWKFPSDTSSIL